MFRDALLVGILGSAAWVLYRTYSDMHPITQSSTGNPPEPIAPIYTPQVPVTPPINQGPYYPTPHPLQPGQTNGPWSISWNGIEFIKRNEGLRLAPYVDGTGHSIGYGHFIPAGQYVPHSITQAEAENYFHTDLNNAENTVTSHVTVPLTQKQFDALVDFVYNIGEPRFVSSTLLRLLNGSDYAAAAQQFLLWKTPPSILPRRRAEMAMFNQSPTSFTT